MSEIRYVCAWGPQHDPKDPDESGGICRLHYEEFVGEAAPGDLVFTLSDCCVDDAAARFVKGVMATVGIVASFVGFGGALYWWWA